MPKNSAKITIDGNTDVKYGSEIQTIVDWVDTTNFVAIAGRGTAKSTVIMARRSMRCVSLMPGAPFAIVADAYTNLINNIMPAVQNGWRIMGLIEGVHYIKGRKPPEAWRKKCHVIVDDYKHVYSFWNGCVIFLGSLDSPSMLAGKSVAHVFFDEAKYASDARAARVMPILRGDAVSFGHCHLYGGVTITTDMPDVTEGEYDWFFRYASEMDPERIVRIIQAADARNEILKRLTSMGDMRTPARVKMERELQYYDQALVKLRKGQTFFGNFSSLSNIDILTVDYVKRLREGALEHHEFLKSVLGMRPGVKQSARFYVLFGPDHKYTDGSTTGETPERCSEQRYLLADKPLDGGMDFGNMHSLVVAQSDHNEYRVHKDFYVLAPDDLRELADQFLDYFATHRNKVLNLYFDRAGNSYKSRGADSAGKIKEAIERRADGRRTGWTVNLMSRGQAIIPQNAEYFFMQELMRGRNPKIPKLLIDEQGCPNLVSSMERAKQRIKYKGDTKLVAKVKTSEKLKDLKKLPKLSTNMSDAFKYLMMRKEWLTATASLQNYAETDPSVAAFMKRALGE